MNPHRPFSCTFLAGLLLAVAGSASAADAWVALLDVDDGVEAYTVRIVAVDEENCLAQIASLRGVQIVEPCQPTASAITDPNDANRTSKTPKPVTEPRDAGGVLGGVGHTGGG